MSKPKATKPKSKASKPAKKPIDDKDLEAVTGGSASKPQAVVARPAAGPVAVVARPPAATGVVSP